MDKGSQQDRDLFDLTDEERVTYSLLGVIRFDSQAVAKAVRGQNMSSIQADQLAKLIDGSHSTGCRFVIKGQGKGWKPFYEKAKSFERLIAVGRFFDERVSAGCTVEEAVIDAAEHFGLSEPTIYRDLSLYRLVPEEDRPAITRLNA